MRIVACTSPASVLSQKSPFIDSANNSAALLLITALHKMIYIIAESDRIVLSSKHAVNMVSRSVKELCIGLEDIESQLLPCSEFTILKC